MFCFTCLAPHPLHHSDVALLELPEQVRSGFVPVELRKAPPQVGERIAVLGYPQFSPAYGASLRAKCHRLTNTMFLELGPTVTIGVIGRVVEVCGRAAYICVSADVAAGNSGGMLIDRYREHVLFEVSTQTKCSNGALVGLVTNNVRDRLGKIIPKLNMSIPAERLGALWAYAKSPGRSSFAVPPFF